MRVVISKAAEDDLTSIFDFLSAQSPGQAVPILSRLENAIAERGEAPLQYPLLGSDETSRVRRRVVRPYNIFYIVQDRAVVIVHVLHGARDHVSILFGRDEA